MKRILVIITLAVFALLQVKAGTDPIKGERVRNDSIVMSTTFAVKAADGDSITFVLRINVPRSGEVWLNELIEQRLYDDLQSHFGPECADDAATMKIERYSGNLGETNAMVRHYYNEFVRLAKLDMACEEIGGSEYLCLFRALPVWRSADGRYQTFRYQIFNSYGGASGTEEEYYLTYVGDEHRLLTYADLFKEDKMDSVVNLINRKVAAWRGDNGQLGGLTEEDFMDYSFIDKVGDLWYPSPAITSKGIVLSYPTYSLGGCHADGIFHCTLSPREVAGMTTMPIGK